jgi:hypothetical protein
MRNAISCSVPTMPLLHFLSQREVNRNPFNYVLANILSCLIKAFRSNCFLKNYRIGRLPLPILGTKYSRKILKRKK